MDVLYESTTPDHQTPNHPPASNQLQALGAQPCPKVCESDSGIPRTFIANSRRHRARRSGFHRSVRPVRRKPQSVAQDSLSSEAPHKNPGQATISVKMSGVGRQVSLRDIESENDRSSPASRRRPRASGRNTPSLLEMTAAPSPSPSPLGGARVSRLVPGPLFPQHHGLRDFSRR